MSDIEYFLATYGFRPQDVILVPYGSRVYGTATASSDYDYIAIIPANRFADTGTEFRKADTNIHMYNKVDFQKQLIRHKIHALEAYFHPDKLCTQFKWELNPGVLREEIASKASHSFVKAKKKIEKEHDYYIGFKSLFHSLRILIFGTQVAQHKAIVDYGAANYLWKEIIEANQYNWEYFKEKYQPVYNELASEFRKVAPKL